MATSQRSAACDVLNGHLAALRSAEPALNWKALVAKAYQTHVPLQAIGHPMDANTYYNWGAACSEVELDLLTGEIEIVRSDIVYDCGISLNPLIDLGQVEGAFVMGAGMLLSENYHPYGLQENERQPTTPSNGLWEYKIPATKDIPQQLNVVFLEDSINTTGVLSSKATAEGPYQLSNSIYLAMKAAIRASHGERNRPEFFHVHVPATVPRRQAAIKLEPSELKLPL